MKNFKSVIAVALILSVLFSNGVYAEELFKTGKPARKTLNTNAVFTDVINKNAVLETATNVESSDASFESVIKETPTVSDVQTAVEETTVVEENSQPTENIDLSGVDGDVKSKSRKDSEAEEASIDDSFTVQGLVLPDIPAYSEDDIILLAKLIWHESEGEPRDGKIAVGEVVLNRINSTIYPDTVNDVIYQKGQFSHVKYVANENPDAETIKIAEDVLNHGLKVLNNAEVLYFRNPMKTSKVPASTEKNWGRHKYFTYYGNHAFYIHTPKKYLPFELSLNKKHKKTEKAEVVAETPEIIVDNQNTIPVEIDVDALGVSSETQEPVADYNTFDTPLMIVVEGGPVVEDATPAAEAINSASQTAVDVQTVPAVKPAENVMPDSTIQPAQPDSSTASTPAPADVQPVAPVQPVITVQPEAATQIPVIVQPVIQ